MKHFNKQVGVNIDMFDTNQNNRKALTEGINLAILIFFGCTGLYLMSQMIGPKKAVSSFSPMTTNTSLAQHSDLDEDFTLEVKGTREPGESMAFFVNNFDSSVKYRINFGDGHVATLQQAKAFHRFAVPGEYEVEVTAILEDQTIRAVKKVNIRH